MLDLYQLISKGRILAKVKESSRKREREKFRSQWNEVVVVIRKDFGDRAWIRSEEIPEDFDGTSFEVWVAPFDKRYTGDLASLTLCVRYTKSLLSGLWSIASPVKATCAETILGGFGCATNPGVAQPVKYSNQGEFSTLEEALYWLHERWKV